MTDLTGNNPQEQGEFVTSKDSKNAIEHGSGGGVLAEGSTADVDHSTISTTEPSPPNQGGQGRAVEGSVVSAITDHASLGGAVNNPNANTLGTGGTGQPDASASVPLQVILPDGDAGQPHERIMPPSELAHEDMSQPPPSGEPEIPLVITQQAPDAQSAASMPTEGSSATPRIERRPLHDRYVSDSAATPYSSDNFQHQKAQQQSISHDNGSDYAVDDYIRSPEVQNAIVERSPGGRYVRFMEKLGSGASKDVYRAYDTQEGIEVAWNVVTLSGVPKTERNRIVNEVRLLERLHHSNIISFHGSWVNRERQEVNFVTEILSSGTLKSFVTKVQVIRWKIAKRWAFQILKGLEYLHSQNPPVIHRDLKCDNIFINGTSGDLRIGDLGLSTVHKNGKVLSVLGTPEFMAPDMYEDRSYDEKVDIYAFGMCMLEILTKEIPYAECNNPAQIYKKVSSGEPPEILTRLESRHAREFVELCMGYKDENGVYVRPSAKELLKHPFLNKRPNDDDEVVVERPLRERSIAETSGDSTGASSIARRRNIPGSTQTVHNAQAPVPATQISGPRNSLSDEEEAKDQFDEMPESETNMKKVKVLMGRDQELEEDDEDEHVAPHDSAPLQQQSSTQASPTYSTPREAAPQQNAPASQYQREIGAPQHQTEQPPQHPEPAQPQAADGSQTHYLVAAVVIENEAPNIRPYADDILKLVVTLPVEGQTQNVQFDFHLVEDDPVKVAKEMVQELGIPQGAILEISETISGIACSARMRQDKYIDRMQQRQGVPAQTREAPSSGNGSQAMVQGGQVASNAMRSSSHSAQSSQTAHVQQSVAPVPHATVQVAQAHPSTTMQAPVAGAAPAGNSNARVPAQAPQTLPKVAQTAPTYPTVGNLPNDGNVGMQGTVATAAVPVQSAQTPAGMQYQTPVTADQTASVPGSVGSGSTNLTQAAQGTTPFVHSHGTTQESASSQAPAVQVSSNANVQQPPPQVSNASSHGAPLLSSSSGAPASPIPNTTGIPPRPPSSSALNSDLAAGLPARPSDASQGSKNGLSPASGQDMFLDTDDDEMCAELRKLEEDYKKNLKIAKKVFDSRMENLERSRIEKEAQHKETLEKHEKERLAFEKKRTIEEEQQLRRIEQLQKEWDKKRETLAQRAPTNGSSEHQGEVQTQQSSQAPVQTSETTGSSAVPPGSTSEQP